MLLLLLLLPPVYPVLLLPAAAWCSLGIRPSFTPVLSIAHCAFIMRFPSIRGFRWAEQLLAQLAL